MGYDENEGIKELKKCLSGEKVWRKITFSAGKELGTFYVDDIYYVEAELSKIHLVTEKEEKGNYQRKNITNWDYINYMKGNLKTLELGRASLESERKAFRSIFVLWNAF